MDNHPDFDNLSLEESNEDLSERDDTESDSGGTSDSLGSSEEKYRDSMKKRYR